MRTFWIGVVVGIITLFLLYSISYASSRDVLLDMIEFIEDNSNYEYNEERLPEIMLTDELPKGVTGVYFKYSRPWVLFISTKAKYPQIAIFHEVVHYMQYVNGVDMTPSREEREAYRLQYKYARYHLQRE